MNKQAAEITRLCPCGTGGTYEACCQPCHLGTPAPNAEALMRSRYTAYVLGLEDYLLKTWHPDTRPARLDLANDAETRWLGLQVKSFQQTGEATATVSFVARYKIAGKAHRLSELSSFVRVTGQWLYVDGVIEQ